MMQAIEWTPEHVAAFQPSVDASPWGALSTVESVLHGAYLLDYRFGGQHALMAVKPVATERGQRLDVAGLVSDGDRLDSARFAGALRDFAAVRGFNLLTMATKREHIARACERAGWQRGGVVMYGWVNRV